MVATIKVPTLVFWLLTYYSSCLTNSYTGVIHIRISHGLLFHQLT